MYRYAKPIGSKKITLPQEGLLIHPHSVSAGVALDSGVLCLHALQWQEAWVRAVSTGSVGPFLCMNRAGWQKDLFGLGLILFQFSLVCGQFLSYPSLWSRCCRLWPPNGA